MPSEGARIIALHRPRGLFVPATEAPLWMWNGWRVHEDSINGLIRGDHILLMPPRCFLEEREAHA